MIHTYRAHQIDAHEHRHQHSFSRRAQTLRWPRRAGKTYYALCEMFEEACAVAGDYAYLAPTWQMIRIAMGEFAVIADTRRWSCAAWPDEIRGPTVRRPEVYLPNGSVVMFSDKPQRWPIGLVIDEGLPRGGQFVAIIDRNIERVEWTIRCFSVESALGTRR